MIQINTIFFNNIAQDLKLSGQILKHEKVIFYHGGVYETNSPHFVKVVRYLYFSANRMVQGIHDVTLSSFE